MTYAGCLGSGLSGVATHVRSYPHARNDADRTMDRTAPSLETDTQPGVVPAAGSFVI
jgi:hypothetical protein